MSRSKGRFQFTLRTLMILVALWAILFSYVKYCDHKDATRLALAHAFCARGIVVGPGSTRLVISPEVSRNLMGSRFRDTLKEVTDTFEIRSIYLDGTAFDDSTVNELSVIPKNLHSVSLADTKITDAGLAWLDNAPNLVALDLKHTRITDEGLRGVGRVSKLFSLDLSGTKVTDAGLRHLKGLNDLRRIVLDDTNITDDSAKMLAEMPNLDEVSLAHTRVTDRGLEYLSTLPKLVSLYLQGTAVTDVGVMELKRRLISRKGTVALHPLLRVDLRDTHVTDTAKRDLKESLNLDWVL